jgi:hypothetical protein
VLASNSRLTELDISGTLSAHAELELLSGSSQKDGLIMLAEVLKRNTALRSLDASRNRWSRSRLDALEAALGANKSLARVVLFDESDDGVADDKLKMVRKVARKNAALVDVGKNAAAAALLERNTAPQSQFVAAVTAGNVKLVKEALDKGEKRIREWIVLFTHNSQGWMFVAREQRARLFFILPCVEARQRCRAC